MQGIENPELKQLYDQMIMDINAKIDSFANVFAQEYHRVVKNAVLELLNKPASEQPPVNPTVPPKIQKNFPSWKNGFKNVLNKFWTPTSETFSLNKFKVLSEEIGKTGENIISEVAPTNDIQEVLKPMFDKFKSDLSHTVFTYFIKANEIIKKSSAAPTVSSTLPEPSDSQKVLNDISKQWWKQTGLDNNKKTEIMKWLTNDLRRNQEANLRIKKKYIQQAVEFMNDHGLDHNKPEDVRKVWPRHVNEPIPEPPVPTRPDPDGEEFDNDPIIKNMYRRKQEKQESVSLDEKTKYFVNLLRNR